jgi:hypothetical protein
LPRSIEPRLSSVCVYLAPFKVAIFSTSNGVIPACKYGSSSRCTPTPAQLSVPARSGMPAAKASILAYDSRSLSGCPRRSLTRR